MINANMVSATPVTEAPTNTEWLELWMKPDFYNPIRYGVQTKLTDGKKLYRAFCNYPADMGGKKLTSPEYVACDEADFTQEAGSYIRPHVRELMVKDATLARARMTENERSANDMATIADEMRQQAVNEYSQFLRDEEVRQKQHVEDQDALKAFRYWLRGAELLLDQGTDQEKATLKTLLGKK